MNGETGLRIEEVGPKLVPALVSLLFLWAAYTIVYALDLPDSISAAVELLPGAIGLVLLVTTFGFKPEQCFLRWRPISRRRLLVLSLFLVALIPVLLSGRWVGWQWLAAIVYAPASGVAQELFFRASLLPALLVLFKRRRLLAVVVHAGLFALWHIPAAFTAAQSEAPSRC